MRDIRRPEQFEPVVKQLTEISDPVTGRTTFATIRDVLVVAASLGFSRKKKISGLKLTNPVPWRIIEGGRKEGLVFLLGLMETQSGEILKTDEVSEENLAQIFEEYACGGLSVIADTLKDNPTDTSGFQTILNFLVDEMHKTSATPRPSGITDVTF